MGNKTFAYFLEQANVMNPDGTLEDHYTYAIQMMEQEILFLNIKVSARDNRIKDLEEKIKTQNNG